MSHSHPRGRNATDNDTQMPDEYYLMNFTISRNPQSVKQVDKVNGGSRVALPSWLSADWLLVSVTWSVCSVYNQLPLVANFDSSIVLIS